MEQYPWQPLGMSCVFGHLIHVVAPQFMFIADLLLLMCWAKSVLASLNHGWGSSSYGTPRKFAMASPITSVDFSDSEKWTNQTGDVPSGCCFGLAAAWEQGPGSLGCGRSWESSGCPGLDDSAADPTSYGLLVLIHLSLGVPMA